MSIKNTLNVKGIKKSVVEFVKGRHKVYDVSGYISFTKPNRWWVVLPNGRMCISAKILRYSSNRDTTLSGLWSYEHNNPTAKYFTDSEFGGDYYKSLAKALEHVLYMLDNNLLITGGINMGKHREGCDLPQGVCVRNDMWFVGYGTVYPADFKSEGKAKRKVFNTVGAAQAFSEGIRDTNKNNLRRLLVEHIRLLKTNPNKLPVFNSDEFAIIKINVAEEVAKETGQSK